MTRTFTNDKSINIAGTMLQGYLPDTGYRQLVTAFGEPTVGESDDGKTRVEWWLRFDDGEIATVYDYKAYDVPVVDLTHWHVGGTRPDVVDYVQEAVQNAVTDRAPSVALSVTDQPPTPIGASLDDVRDTTPVGGPRVYDTDVVLSVDDQRDLAALLLQLGVAYDDQDWDFVEVVRDGLGALVDRLGVERAKIEDMPFGSGE